MNPTVQKFVLNVKPFSINQVHYRDGKRKTRECRDWEITVFNALNTPEYLASMALLRQDFDPKKHAFKIELTCCYPASYFRTKDGNISSKTQDITNWEKPLVDLIFLDKYSLSPSPFGIENIQIDDKFIVEMLSKKVAYDGANTMLLVSVERFTLWV